jgi:hypothetical protein
MAGGLNDHTRTHGFVGAFVDEQYAARDAILAVGIHKQGFGGAQGDAGDVVHADALILQDAGCPGKPVGETVTYLPLLS